jgi:hypothetical protein
MSNRVRTRSSVVPPAGHVSTPARTRAWPPWLLCVAVFSGCSVGDVTAISRDAGSSGSDADASLDKDSETESTAGRTRGLGGAAGHAGTAGTAGTAGSAGTGGVAGSSGEGGTAGVAGSSGASGSAGSAGAAGAGPILSTTFFSTVADCVTPSAPNPDVCAAVEPDVLRVDLEVTELSNQTAVGFIRFDPGGPITGRTVVHAEVHFRVGTSPDADSPHSGRLWQVEPFERADLYTSPLPAQVGTLPVGEDLGAVTQGQVVTWEIPPGLVSAGEPLCIGIYPISTDGVEYLGTASASPPQLFVEYQ